MNRIRSEILETALTDNINTRGKSIFGSATNKTLLDWRKYIRLIETRYNEVLIEGSFKFCRRICELLGLKFLPSLELMLVEDWAHECLENRKVENCCWISSVVMSTFSALVHFSIFFIRINSLILLCLSILWAFHMKRLKTWIKTTLLRWSLQKYKKYRNFED